MAQPLQAIMHPAQASGLDPEPVNGTADAEKTAQYIPVAQNHPATFSATPPQATSGAPAPSNYLNPPIAKAPNASGVGASSKANRLSKACDSCSIRKVKCDEEGPPCRACRALDIPCTFQRPSRRRGPPNKHAEAIKRQRIDPYDRHNSSSTASSSPPFPIGSTHAPPYNSTALGAASLCPIELIELLIDDFFTYVQPIKPFPHEPWFRERFRQRDDTRDWKFRALLASMIGAIVSSYPRRPQKHLKQLGLEHLFPSSLDFVNKCQDVVFACRGSGYLQKAGLGVYDAATSYFLMAMNAHTYRMVERELHLGESLNIIRMLGYHRPPDPSKPLPSLIELETGRRIYWTIFVTVRTSIAFMDDSSVADTMIPPQTPTRPHPPLPLEVDDHYIFHDSLRQQPHGVVSRLTGFNAKIHIYLAHDPWIAMELVYGVHKGYGRAKQMEVLAECLDNTKKAFHSIPEQFVVWPGPPSHSTTGTPPTMSMDQDFGPANLDVKPSGGFSQGNLFENVGPRQSIAYEIQKAGIHAAYLTTRSYFAEKLWALSCGMRPPPTEGQNSTGHWGLIASEADMRTERNSIAEELLSMLSSIRPIHLEPNAFPFCMQIRQIASTLIPSTGPAGQVSATVQGSNLESDDVASQYIRRFMQILAGIEKGGIHGPADHQKATANQFRQDQEEEREEEELRRWADLRQNQHEFAQRGSIHA